VVGAVLVGSYISEMVNLLTETAVARVTLYDPKGSVLGTTIGARQQAVTNILQEPVGQYRAVQALLSESPERHSVVLITAESEVPLKRVKILGDYTEVISEKEYTNSSWLNKDVPFR